MILGIVIENVVATIKHPALDTHRLFWVQPLAVDGSRNGDPFLALDSVDAGLGDTVLVCNEGTGCRQIFDTGVFPVNHMIAGFVDRVEAV